MFHIKNAKSNSLPVFLDDDGDRGLALRFDDEDGDNWTIGWLRHDGMFVLASSIPEGVGVQVDKGGYIHTEKE